MIYILFGPPGVGKSYIGQLIHREFDIPYFDADDLNTEEFWNKLKNKQYNQIDRNSFVQKLSSYVQEHIDSNLVIAEAFTKEQNRKDFIRHFVGKIQFIRVFAEKEVARKRLEQRSISTNHVIDVGLFDWLWNEFDEPMIPYMTLLNNGAKDDTILDNCRNYILIK